MSIIKRNPFIINSPLTIDQADLYVEREQEVTTIYQAIFGSVEPQTVAIYGPPRCGKSSLLSFLASNLARKRFCEYAAAKGQKDALDLIGRTVFVGIDLRLIPVHLRDSEFTPAFWKEFYTRTIAFVEQSKNDLSVHVLSEEISDVEERNNRDESSYWTDRVYGLLDNFIEQGIFFVIQLDHSEIIFELAQGGGYQISEVLAELRRIFRGHLVYISSVPKTLTEMEKQFREWMGPGSPESPFYAGIEQIFIGLYRSVAQAQQVIASALDDVKAVDAFSQDEIDMIGHWGGYHPYTLNVVAHILFSYKSAKEINTIDPEATDLYKRVNAILDRFFRQNWNNLRFLENGLNGSGICFQIQKTVIRLALDIDIESSIDLTILESLQEIGVVVFTKDGQPSLFSGLFGDFVIRRTFGTSPLDLVSQQNDALALDDQDCTVSLNGHRLNLKGRHYRILRLLLAHPGKSVSLQDISNIGYLEGESAPEKQVAVWFTRLRQTLKDADSGPIKLDIVKLGEGYAARIELDEEFLVIDNEREI